MLLNYCCQKSLILILLSLSWGVFVCPGQAQEEPPAIPANPLDVNSTILKSHLESAARNSWRMSLQDILVNRAEAFSIRSSSGKRPSVGLNLTAGYQYTESTNRELEGMNYRFNFTARQSLYSWGAVEADHQFGLLQVEQAKHDRHLAFLSIYRDVIFRYIDLVVAKQRLYANRLALAIQKADLDLRRSEVERGEYPETQFSVEELGFDRADLQRKQMENSFNKNEDFFKEFIGVDDGYQLSYDKVLPKVPTDLVQLEAKVDAFIASLDDNSLKVLSKKARLDQELKRLKKYEVNQRPKLNAIVRIRRDTEDFTTGQLSTRSTTESLAGFEVSWNIYDGKSTKSLILESLESKRQLERELEILKDDIIDNLKFLLADLKVLKAQVDISETSFGWEAGEYEQVEKDVAAGRLPEKTLQTAKRDLESQRTDLLLNRGLFFKSLTELYLTLEDPFILAYLEQ